MQQILRFLRTSDTKYLLMLAVLSLVGYWQLSFMVHPLKWDMIDYFFPSRFIIGEMLQQHTLPLWNPYQMLGYPIYADPQSGAWYPITWIIGGIHGYSVNAVNFEYILHLFFAAWGMFVLGKALDYHRPVAFLMAVAYLFCGFFVGNAQHLSWIISATWMPFVLANFLLLAKEKSWRSALKLSFFGFLLLSGGYPGFVFVLVYILGLLLVYFSVAEYRQSKREGLLRYYKYLLGSLIVLVFCSAIVVVSNYYLIPLLTRSAGVTPEMALVCPFSPRCALSFLAPLSVVNHAGSNFFQSDLSMTNGYFGILLFAFMAAGVWMRKSPIQWVFFSLAILNLLIAFGEYTPLRMVLYDYVPLMNLFRFPALFRLFFILFFLIAAGDSVQAIFYRKERIPLALMAVSATLILFMGGLILVIRSQGYLDLRTVITRELFQFSLKTTIQQQFVVHAAVQIVVLAVFLLILWRFKASKRSLTLIIALVTLEMLVSTQLTAPYTVYDAPFSNGKCQAFLNSLPAKFPLPTSVEVGRNEAEAKKESPFWRNTCSFNKTLSHEGFNPFKLNDIQYLEASLPQFFTTMLRNPSVYLSNSIFPREQLEAHVAQQRFDSTFVYLETEEYQKYKSMATFDSFAGRVKMVEFSPDRMVMEVNSTKEAVMVLLQNGFTGWRASINQKEAKILRVNIATMGVAVPAGKSNVVFEYRPTPVIWAYYISIISFIALALSLLAMELRASFKSAKGAPGLIPKLP